MRQLNAVARAAFGRTRDEVKPDHCICHGELVGEFRDEVSRKEYRITKMCQRGQDELFGGPEEEAT
jgi:hypothetical protein